jgi:hypothetical protein
MVKIPTPCGFFVLPTFIQLAVANTTVRNMAGTGIVFGF